MNELKAFISEHKTFFYRRIFVECFFSSTLFWYILIQLMNELENEIIIYADMRDSAVRQMPMLMFGTQDERFNDSNDEEEQ